MIQEYMNNKTWTVQQWHCDFYDNAVKIVKGSLISTLPKKINEDCIDLIIQFLFSSSPIIGEIHLY